jgi:hypothetical protein
MSPRWWSTLFAHSTRPPGSRGRPARPAVEPLPARDLPAALGLLVPAYFDPTPGNPGWGQIAAAAGQVPIMAIMNPDNGPGRHIQADYVAAVSEVQAAGGQVLGYVHTSDTHRSLDQVEAEVNHYRRWYHVNGIFVDEVTSDGSRRHLRYYGQLDNFIHRRLPGSVVVANPGDNAAEAYTGVADELVLFEDGFGYDTYAPPPWQPLFPASRFANIAYSVPSVAAMQTDVALAVSRHTGWVYVTDAGLPNPYGTLPGYWPDLVAAVAAQNAAPPG